MVNQDDDLSLKYGARHVIKLFIPVTLCMAAVVATISSITFYTEKDEEASLIYTPFHEQSEDMGTLVWQSLANAVIIVVVLALVSLLLVLAYKYKCTRLIKGVLFLLSLCVFFIMSYLYLYEVLKAHNLPLDFIATAILIWNFGIMGLIALYWKAPLIMQQAYLIFASAMMALIFIKTLPDWTAWTVLGAVSLWDLFAVLSPCGPLRILVETAHERGEQIFSSIIYVSGVVYTLMGTADRDTERGLEQSMEEDEEDRSVQLGLGDFIFYSILVGKASSYGDWNTTLACFVAILIGLCLTLVFLTLLKKALPALPISIFLGLLFYFVTREIITPFCDELSSRQIFI